MIQFEAYQEQPMLDELRAIRKTMLTVPDVQFQKECYKTLSPFFDQPRNRGVTHESVMEMWKQAVRSVHQLCISHQNISEQIVPVKNSLYVLEQETKRIMFKYRITF